MANLISPGMFGTDVPADKRRIEFDFKNEVIVENNIEVESVFFGDSITHFWELPVYFGNDYGLFLNRGIDADDTRYAIRRLEADVIQLHPKSCIILLGINDTWYMEYDNWSRTPGEPYTSVFTTASNNYTDIVLKLLANSIQPVICSLLPTDMPWTNAQRQRERYVTEFNDFLKKLCKECNLKYIDYYSEFMLNSDVLIIPDPHLYHEGLHPNVYGYNKMANILKRDFFDVV